MTNSNAPKTCPTFTVTSVSDGAKVGEFRMDKTYTTSISSDPVVRRKPKLDRVRSRPEPSLWGDDELMTLAEAAALLWPDGPLTETSLRTAARDGLLPIATIAGKFFVTKTALKRLAICRQQGQAFRSTGQMPRMANKGHDAGSADRAPPRR